MTNISSEGFPAWLECVCVCVRERETETFLMPIFMSSLTARDISSSPLNPQNLAESDTLLGYKCNYK